MSLLSAQNSTSSFSISEHFYSLEVDHKKQSTELTMMLTIPTVNTKYIPLTFAILNESLPSIFDSMCFNDDKLPFIKEVTATEVGHLFEHALLEYLCEEKLARGFSDVEYSGETKWNWREDPRGTFHITISRMENDSDIFQPALAKTIKLINIILQSTIEKDIPSIHVKPALYNSMAKKPLLN
jgi:hypothetical protein